MACQKTISDAGEQCLKLFDACLSKHPHDEVLARLEYECRRFQTWAKSLKVFERTNFNLDAQLRQPKYDQIREMVQLLLDVLGKNLSLGMAFPSSLLPGLLFIW